MSRRFECIYQGEKVAYDENVAYGILELRQVDGIYVVKVGYQDRLTAEAMRDRLNEMVAGQEVESAIKLICEKS